MDKVRFNPQIPGVEECNKLAADLWREMQRYGFEDAIFFGIGRVRQEDERTAFLRGRASMHMATSEEHDAFMISIGHNADCEMITRPTRISVCSCGWRERVGPDGTGAP